MPQITVIGTIPLAGLGIPVEQYPGIADVDLILASNPLFGLHTFGGVLSVHTKRGGDFPGTTVGAYGGSFRRSGECLFPLVASLGLAFLHPQSRTSTPPADAPDLRLTSPPLL